MSAPASPERRMPARWSRVARVPVAVIGGYLFTNWSMASFALVLTIALGVRRGDAVILACLLGFPTYVAAIVWAIGAPRFARVVAGLAAACLLSFVLAHWLATFGPAAAAIGGR